jgi:hypothetical protein
MALTFKRTGGAKESSSSGGAGRDRKMGTGSITCKDVFRSVIVLGESSVLDDDGETALLGSILAMAKADDDGDELENDSCARMKHYGGSERTVDGGGMYHGGVNGGRKSSLGGAAEAATAPVKRKDSVSSKEIDVESDASKDVDVRDESNDGDSSNADEYVPIVSKKRKSTEGPKQRKAANEFPADAEEEITTARKRPPRRSVTATKVRYVDESNESDLDGSDSDKTVERGSDEDVGEEGHYHPKSMPIAIQSDAKKAVSKPPIAASAKHGGASKKRHKVKDGLVGSKSIDSGEDRKYKGKPRGKKPPANKVSNGSDAINVATKKTTSADMKKSDDIIEIDSTDEDVEIMSTPKKRHKVDEKSLQGNSADATRRLSTLSSPSKSPSKAPISYGRRKKNSPKVEKESNKGRDNDLNLDDDSFTFL